MQTIQEIIDGPELTPKKKIEFYQAIVHSIIESMYQTGTITDEHLHDPQKLKAILLDYSAKGLINMVVDHRETILDSAKKYKKENNYEYATLFFAIYFEHTLNSIIEKHCSRNKINKKTTNEIIKSVTIHGKLTWLLTLFKLPKINETHKVRIIKNADDRNSFVHYKYNPGHDDPKASLAEEKRRLDDLVKIQKTVAYIKRYESLVLFDKKKKHFKKALTETATIKH